MALQSSSASSSQLQADGAQDMNSQLIPVARLVSTHPRLNGKTFEIRMGEQSFGSAATCDIVLGIDGIAPHHCSVIVNAGESGPAMLVKAISHLSWINDGVANARYLKIGDRLILGPVSFKVMAYEPASAVPESVQATASIKSPISLADRHQNPDDASQETDAASRLERLLRKPDDAEQTQHHGSDLGSVRRHHQTEELLTEIQSALDSVIERERSLKVVFEREQSLLDHRGEELSAQWRQIEETKASFKSIEDQLAQSRHAFQIESATLEESRFLIDERYQELASRAAEIARKNRVVKQQSKAILAAQQAGELAQQEIQDTLTFLNSQSLQLSERAEEIDLREVELKTQIEQVRRDRARLSDREASIEEEEQLWARKLQSREKYLTDLEAELTLRGKKLAKHESNFKDQVDQEIAAAKLLAPVLDPAEVLKFEQDQAQLVQDQSQLEADRQQYKQDLEQLKLRREQFEISSLDLANFQSELGVEYKKLEQEKDSLKQLQAELELKAKDVEQLQISLTEERSRFEAEVEEFSQRQALLEASSLELEHLQRGLVEERAQMNDFQEREADLEARTANLESRLADLDADQQNHVRLRMELEAERSRDSYEREQLVLRCKQFESQTSELLARELELLERSTALEKSQEEFSFLQSQTQLQHGNVESELVAQLRAQLAESVAEREQARLEQHALTEKLKTEHEQRSLQERELLAEIEELRTEREEFIKQQFELSSGWEDLEASREVLKQQLLQLKAAKEALELPSDRMSSYVSDDSVDCEVSEDKDQFATEFNDVEEKGDFSAVEEEDFDDGTPSILDLFLNEKPEPQQESKPWSAPPDRESVADFTGHVNVHDVQSDMPVEAEDADDLETRELRSQLASLFGMTENSGSKQSRRERPIDREDAALAEEHSSFFRQDSDGAHPQEALESEERSLEEEVVAEHAAKNETPASSEDDEEDMSVESYMQRLLARNRKGPEEPAPVAKRAVKTNEHRRQEDYQRDSESSFQEDVLQQRPSRKARKFADGEKEQIRAGLDSFRDLANFSARSAIANSKASQTVALIKVMLGLSAIGWVSTAALLIASYTMKQSYLMEAGLVGAVSVVMTLLSLVRLWEVKQMTIVSDMPAEEVNEEVSRKGAHADKSPLSFL